MGLGKKGINPVFNSLRKSDVKDDHRFLQRYRTGSHTNPVKQITWCILFGIMTMAVLAKEDQNSNCSSENYSSELLKKGEAGDVKAQLALWHCYSSGRHGVDQDQKEALKWLTKAADQGDPVGQVNLGWSYAKGAGVTKDEKQAVVLFSKAAEQGSGLGQGSLAICYAKGAGVIQDDKRAIEWFTKGAVKYFSKQAEAGDAKSQATLGLFYPYGIGVEKNEKKAIELLMNAAKQVMPTAF